ncbi:MAG: alpha/beta fold hydrolase [Egibacteraceae bacterium]
MAQILANGVKLHVQRIAPKGGPRGGGRHPTVVFVHGLGTDSLASFYFTLAGPVSAAGVDVIAYDLRGHGRSERPPTGYRLADSVADLAGLLDALAPAGPVHLVGNSYGGTVAFSYAVAHPEQVASVVMIESEPATQTWSRKMAYALETVAEFGHADVLTRITEDYGTRTARLAKAASQTLHTTTMVADIPAGPLLSREQVRSVRCPVLAVFGGESDLVDQAEVLEAELCDCRVVVVPGQEHSVLVEAPRAVRDLLLAWVAEHDDPALSGFGAQVGWG